MCIAHLEKNFWAFDSIKAYSCNHYTVNSNVLTFIQQQLNTKH